MNKIFLLGRLVRDPDIRTTQSGKMTTEFTLAVDRYPGSKDTDFIKIVTWEKLAEAVGNNLQKGQRAMVEGRLQIRSYEGKDGQKRWVTEVISNAVEFLDRKRDMQQQTATDPGPITDAGQFGSEVSPDDEIPF